MVALNHLAAFQSAIAALSFGHNGVQTARCDISNFTLSLPGNQTQLALPTNSTPTFVGLAFGVQNYTCSQNNNFTNIGAVAELFDVSCLTTHPAFPTLQDPLYAFWNNFTGASIQDVISLLHTIDPTEVLAQHYFVTNPATGQGFSPKWDFASQSNFKGNQNAVFVGKGQGTLPAPTNSTTDVAWLEVANVQGDIANTVFRTDTRGGQPPASCVYGESLDISVKYASKYFFFGGSLPRV